MTGKYISFKLLLIRQLMETGENGGSTLPEVVWFRR
jgi:hypothetical protein